MYFLDGISSLGFKVIPPQHSPSKGRPVSDQAVGTIGCLLAGTSSRPIRRKMVTMGMLFK
eukprot:scaffold3598_cov115-Cylindrotheca_fusiformis.AAC.6